MIDSFENKVRDGAYWGIRGDMSAYDAPDRLPCPLERTTELANLATRLGKLDRTRQERLINWGYAISDAAIRTFFNKTHVPPRGFPYPAVDV